MVTAAKPKVGGAVSYAALGTTLPVSALTEATGFTSVGYISEDGVTRTMEMDSEVVKAWGGDVVLVLDRGKTEKFKFKMLESTSVPALKLLHGDDNVTGTDLATGIAVQSNNNEKGGHAFVIDMIEAENTLHRICIPDGVITDVSEINYIDSDAVGYEIEVTAIADAAGQTCYEYFRLSGSAASPSVDLNTHSTSVEAGETVTLTAVTYPTDASVTWTSSSETAATVAAGVVSGLAAGSTIITAAITVNGVTYSDTCTVVVTA